MYNQHLDIKRTSTSEAQYQPQRNSTSATSTNPYAALYILGAATNALHICHASPNEYIYHIRKDGPVKTAIQTKEQPFPVKSTAKTDILVVNDSCISKPTADSHSNSHIHHKIHTHDGCPLTHNNTIVHFHGSASLA
jgi:hypothetical protein